MVSIPMIPTDDQEELCPNCSQVLSICECEVESDTEGAPKFAVLVERFRRKVALIPADCHSAIFYWHRSKQIQSTRIALENQLRQITAIGKKVFWADKMPESIQNAMASEPETIKQIRLLEDKYSRTAEREFKKSRWYNEVALSAAEGVGMGPSLAGAFLWTIGSASRFASFGRIVRYAALDVTSAGKAPKKAAGSKISWNPALRVALFKLTEGWNKMPDSIWRARWDVQKVFYREKFPQRETYFTIDRKTGKKTKKIRYNDGHIHNMARRKIQREFLRNLYHLWLEFEAETVTGE